MKKIKYFFIIVILFYESIAFSQIQNFDTSYVIASSPSFDYKNPVFNYIHGFSFTYSKDWIAYEKSDGGTSNIILRRFSFSEYDPQIQITNDTGIQNINPSIAGNIYTGYIILWQTNKNGNWDIYYSRFDSTGNFSAPAPIGITTDDENNPYATLLNDNRFIFAYERSGDIIVERFNQSTGNFFGDTNITTHIVNNCNKPIITGNFDIGFVTFETDNTTYTNLRSKRFWLNSDTSIILQTEWINNQQNSQENLSSAFANADFLIYDYDTLGTKQVVYADPDFSDYFFVTEDFLGSCTNGRSMYFPIITEAGFSPQMSAFAFIQRLNDSTIINAARMNFDPIFRQFYLGDSSVQTKLNISNYIFSQSYYKIRIVWEQDINGRTALVESFMTDLIDNITQISNSIPTHLSLHQNYPNPFNPETKIKFEIPLSVRGQKSEVKLSVYDVSGKEVRTLVNSELAPGVYEYTFDGARLSSGVYYYKLESGGFIETKKMVLVK